MFKDLRAGTPFYILYKGKSPDCKIGSVVSVSQPVPKFMNNYTLGQTQEMIVDIKVKVDEGTVTFEKIPANMVIADFIPAGSEGMVISCNKDAINSEIESLIRISQNVIDSVDYHEKAVQVYKEALKVLNPVYAREAEQEEKISKLEAKISGMEKMFGMGFEELKQLIVDNSKKNEVSNSKKQQ